jgi:hypothetical protein
MRSPVALVSLLALALVLPLAVLAALSCDDAEGLAMEYENPTWPCRPDAVVAEGPVLPADSGVEDSRVCWQKCQVHQTWQSEDGVTGQCIDLNEGEPNWGKIQDLTIARERCYNEDYRTPSLEDLLTLLDNCVDVGLDYGPDGGPTEPSDASVHVTRYECESCNQSNLCSELFVEQMRNAFYWSETRCPRSHDDVNGDPEEDWRGRWVFDFGTGTMNCHRTTDMFSSLCLTEAPDPYPSMY